MKHRNSHLLVGYWNRLRQGRDAPDLMAFDPRVVKRMLSSVIVLDVENPSLPTYRLAGTEVCERFGSELRGKGFLANWDAKSSARLPSLLRQGLKLSQPICLSSIGAGVAGVVELETVLAPVRGNGAGANRFIGAIQIFGDPTLLANKPISVQGLTGSQLISENDLAPAFDDASAPPSSGPRGHSRARHLRLVTSRPSSQTVHFSDQSARQFIASLDAGLQRDRGLRHESDR